MRLFRPRISWRVVVITCIALLLGGAALTVRPDGLILPNPGARAVDRHAFTWRSRGGRVHTMDLWHPSDVRPGETLAVLLFSPGYEQSPPAYDRLIRRMAARGYAVLAVRHQYSEPFSFATQVGPLASDLLDGLDFATSRQASGDMLFGRMNLRRVGAFGHAFGGAIAAEVCTRDARVVAGMDLDGSIFGRALRNGTPCPFFLLMSALPWTENFRREPPKFSVNRDPGHIHEQMLFDRSATAYWLTVSGLEHMSFADAALASSARDRFTVRLGLRLDAARTHELTARYLSAFFGRYLRNESDTALLDQSPYPFATLRRRVAPSARH